MGRLEEAGEFVWRQTGQGVWVETPVPDSPEWMVAALFLPHEEQLTLVELRVFPNRGRFAPAADAEAHTFEAGGRKWTLGPPEVARGFGEWSRNPDDLAGLAPGGLHSRGLRRIPVGEIIDRVHELAAQANPARLPRGWADAVRRAPARPGRPGRDDSFYAVWAARYAEKAGSRRPIAELAAEHGKEKSRVRDWVMEARRRDLLSKPGQGRPGGALTEKARRLLAAAQDEDEPQPKKTARRKGER